ncbi:MAG: hypothetical protein K9J38_13735 [Polynucleobacter sp.]|nr:hypothetical protein [Polynucleobacter sp.]
MVHKFTQYEQKLLDTVVSLRKEVSNLSESYRIVNARLNEISLRMNNDASDSLREAINIEELARLAAVAAAVAHQAAVILLNGEGIEKTTVTKKTAEEAYTASLDSSNANRLRQVGGVITKN